MSQGSQNHEPQSQEDTHVSISLIAIELKGLAAPGEALKNLLPPEFGPKIVNLQRGLPELRQIERL